MFRQGADITTLLEAVDELSDVLLTLEGLSSLMYSLSKSEMHEPKAIALAACILDYAAITTKETLKLLHYTI